MQRISIIGISGAGKSVFSRKLAQQTKLPLFYIDQLLWKGNWQEVAEKEYLVEHEKLIQKESWIIEGYIDQKMAERLKKSELVIFLDYPGWLAAFRVFMRWLQHRKKSRPELPKEATEKLQRKFLWMVFKREERLLIKKAFELAKISPKKLIVLRSPKELRRLENKIIQQILS
jgi:adenylate kinase family enzyme